MFRANIADLGRTIFRKLKDYTTDLFSSKNKIS